MLFKYILSRHFAGIPQNSLFKKSTNIDVKTPYGKVLNVLDDSKGASGRGKLSTAEFWKINTEEMTAMIKRRIVNASLMVAIDSLWCITAITCASSINQSKQMLYSKDYNFKNKTGRRLKLPITHDIGCEKQDLSIFIKLLNDG